MSLANLIRGKNASGKFATATPATFATQSREGGATVATVATVAVAKSLQEQTASWPKVGAGETASRWWLLHFADREPVEVSCTPPATHADILERHPDAVAAEPFEPAIRQPSAPLAADEEAQILRWLAQIGEGDRDTIGAVIRQCQHDAYARAYYLRRAAEELPKPDPFPDDRRTCDQCANLAGMRCMAAKRGEIVASRNYEPIRDLPRRCEGYAPGADDPDRRHGRERWPWLIQKGGE